MLLHLGRRRAEELGDDLDREDAGDLPYVLVVSRVDSVDTQTINGITLELQRLAGEYCARYDGWECEVMRAEPVQR